MPKYQVLMSESLGKTIEVEAESEDEAMEMVNNGDWYDKDVVREKVIDRFAVEAEKVNTGDSGDSGDTVKEAR